jgi:small subunit ribosomal protein S16
MAVRIRLMRMGSKRRPFYRFVVADSRGKRDGGFLEQIGHYNPIEQPQKIEVDEDKVFDWLMKGAQLSDGARSLLKKTGTLARWDAKRTGREAPQKSLSTEAAPPAAPPAEEAASETAAAEKAPAEQVAPEAAAAEKAPAEAVAPEAATAEKAPAEAVAPEAATAEKAPAEPMVAGDVSSEQASAAGEAPAEEKPEDKKETDGK